MRSVDTCHCKPALATSFFVVRIMVSPRPYAPGPRLARSVLLQLLDSLLFLNPCCCSAAYLAQPPTLSPKLLRAPSFKSETEDGPLRLSLDAKGAFGIAIRSAASRGTALGSRGPEALDLRGSGGDWAESPTLETVSAKKIGAFYTQCYEWEQQ